MQLPLPVQFIINSSSAETERKIYSNLSVINRILTSPSDEQKIKLGDLITETKDLIESAPTNAATEFFASNLEQLKKRAT